MLADDTLTEVKVSGNDLPSGIKIYQDSVEVTADVNGDYILNANDLTTVKAQSLTQITSDGVGGFKLEVIATATEDVSGDTTIITSVLVDGIVEGIEYVTSSGITGFTDENGQFNHKSGDSVTFSVGGVTLGVATAEDLQSGHTFLQDIADVDRTDLNDEYLENMAVFLQSIDTATSGDNIVITKDMRFALENANIDLRTASEEDVKELIDSIGASYVEESEAMEHVKEMLEEYAGIDSEEFEEHVSDDLQQAVIGKEPQSGIQYQTSSGIEGITTDDGNFEFNIGDEITFLKDGEAFSTIDSQSIGIDSLITLNELSALNKIEIDLDTIELNFDNLDKIIEENNKINEEENQEKIEDLTIDDILNCGNDLSLTSLLGESEDDVISNNNEVNLEIDSNDEYCPFKALEQSSENLLATINHEDSIDTIDN